MKIDMVHTTSFSRRYSNPLLIREIVSFERRKIINIREEYPFFSFFQPPLAIKSSTSINKVSFSRGSFLPRFRANDSHAFAIETRFARSNRIRPPSRKLPRTETAISTQRFRVLLNAQSTVSRLCFFFFFFLFENFCF